MIAMLRPESADCRVGTRSSSQPGQPTGQEGSFLRQRSTSFAPAAPTFSCPRTAFHNRPTLITSLFLRGMVAVGERAHRPGRHHRSSRTRSPGSSHARTGSRAHARHTSPSRGPRPNGEGPIMAENFTAVSSLHQFIAGPSPASQRLSWFSRAASHFRTVLHAVGSFPSCSDVSQQQVC
ncbi:hypothetical protein B0T14DRAFT_315955 [Immersiella caudata]|uniref:Uncharacterized protein n=1 Tax=Immersiella caudata TaxID=314043 RepID=A0AA39U290_9PEZI|nr:hypothetical protein B0T14DRAFT_315955 [Immersiella caudata]